MTLIKMKTNGNIVRGGKEYMQIEIKRKLIDVFHKPCVTSMEKYGTFLYSSKIFRTELICSTCPLHLCAQESSRICCAIKIHTSQTR